MKPISKDYLKAHKELHTEAWQKYEFEKNLWKQLNPNATPDEYLKAVRAIADRLGV